MEVFSSAVHDQVPSVTVHLNPVAHPCRAGQIGKGRSGDVERSPHSRHSRRRPVLAAGRLATAIAVAASVGLALPSSSAGAAGGSPTPSLKVLLARAAKISNEIDVLGQQYDAMRIQLTQAHAQLRIARLTERRDRQLLAMYQSSVAGIASAGYMAGSISPTLQLLESSNPQAMLDRASILTELQHENSTKIGLVSAANAAAERADVMAVQEAAQAVKLSAAMRAEVAKIQAKESVLNSAVYAKALAVYQQTGHYPVHLNGNSIGVEAVRAALTRLGYPYVWGAAGPTAFDCSGLVVWAYAQIGISLYHYTGDLWNEGEHISRSQLQPGDLVFFFADLGHVGIYVGNGMMIDAPSFGQPVQIQPVFWSVYAGAVRIA
jgi:peptidoglycan DL-endopeptidase CwlO